MADIAKVGIIGAGTMGGGIAQTCAAAGFDVAMVDVADVAVQRGLADDRFEPRPSSQKGKNFR